MSHISFSDYIRSKQQLREALLQDPIHTVVYEVKKYCRIPLGETKDSKEYYNLKPKQYVSVKWKYADLDGIPEPLSVTIPLDEGDTNLPTFQTGERLMKWLSTNAQVRYE